MGLALLLTLFGCVESKVLTVPRAETYESVPANSGVVVVRIVDASSTRYPINFLTLAPKDVFDAEENKFSRIEASNELLSGGSSTVYVAVLPAATYSLSEISSFYIVGERLYFNAVSATPTFGTFKVVPNRLTNLGTIIYYPKPDGDQYSEVLVRNDSFDDAGAYLNEVYPKLAGNLLSTDGTLAWDEDDYQSERQSQYLSVVQNPIAFDRGRLYEDEVVFLARAGALLRRDNRGNWTLDAVESDLNLLGFDKNRQGDEVASGEFGTLFYKPNGAAEWTSMKLPTVTASVTGVALDDSGRIFAYVADSKSVTLYSTQASTSSDWQALLYYRSDRDWVTPQRDAAITAGYDKYQEETGSRPKRQHDLVEPAFFKLDGRQYFIERNKLFQIDPEQPSGTRVRLKFSIKELAPFRDQLTAIHKPRSGGGWLYSTGSDFDGKWVSIRRDLDRCPGLRPDRDSVVCPDRPVRKLVTHNHIGVPRFVSPTLAFSILKNASRPLKKSDKKFLAKSEDGGRTWVSLEGQEDFPQYCNQMLPLNDDEKLLIGCSGTTGKIYEFDIASATWSLVREPNAF